MPKHYYLKMPERQLNINIMKLGVIKVISDKGY